VVLRDFLRDASVERGEEEGAAAPDQLCRDMRGEALALFKYVCVYGGLFGGH
jgi:hypothetical protein